MDHVEVCRRIWEQKAKVDALKGELDKATKVMTSLQYDAIKLLDAQGLTKQHIPGAGTIFVQTAFSVKVPKEPEQKFALYDYIDKKFDGDVTARCEQLYRGGEFTVGQMLGPTLLGMLSIHSATLNSFYSEELEAAKAMGDVRWALPGVGEPEVYKKIGTRKE